MKNVLLLGGNKLHRGFDEWKHRNKVDNIIVVDWNESPAYQGDHHFREDIKDVEKVLRLAMQIHPEELLMCYTSADIAVPTQVAVHKHAGFLYPSEEAVQNSIIKAKSTKKWEESGILNRYSKRVNGLNELTVPSHIEDIIIKPNISSGSRGITIIRRKERTQESLEKAFAIASACSLDRAVVVEEFLHGTEYTVEMLGDDYGNVAVYGVSKKYHTPYVSNNKIAVKLHYNPNDVSDEMIEKIAEAGRKCYKAIGLRNSLGHLEIIVSEDGRISPVEIGARSSGFIATHCIDKINDDSFLLKYADVIRGGKVHNGIVFDQKKSSMYFFYDVPSGTSCDATNIMDFSEDGIESVQWDRDALTPNRTFSAITQDAERIGFEILAGSRNTLTIDKVNKMEAQFVGRFMGPNSR